jgi:hypothetical protein
MDIIRTFVLPASVAATITLLTSGYALAKGGYVRPPPIEDLLNSPDISDKPLSSVSLGELLSRCGTHRHYDLNTQRCYGPADD